MDFNDLTKPVLTEPGVKYFLNQTLKQCHVVRNNFHNTVFNIGMFIGFLIILGLILLYKYKGRLTNEEQHPSLRTHQPRNGGPLCFLNCSEYMPFGRLRPAAHKRLE